MPSYNKILHFLASHGLDTWREKAEQLIAPISVEAAEPSSSTTANTSVYIYIYIYMNTLIAERWHLSSYCCVYFYY